MGNVCMCDKPPTEQLCVGATISSGADEKPTAPIPFLFGLRSSASLKPEAEMYDRARKQQNSHCGKADAKHLCQHTKTGDTK